MISVMMNIMTMMALTGMMLMRMTTILTGAQG